MKQCNIRFIGQCYDLNSEGKGVVKYNDVIGFVDDLLPGEKAEIKITYLKKDIFFGEVINIIEKSSNRVKPRCSYFDECGGCALMHLSYQGQLIFKKNKVAQCLSRIGGIKAKVNDTIGMDNPYNYRNKIQMPIKLSKKGKVVSGFYKEKTHDIVALDTCQIENKKADKILLSIKALMKDFRVLPYDEDTRGGVIRHVLIRTSHYFNQIMVVLITNCDSFPGRHEFVRALIKKNPEITTVVQNINSRDTNVILGDKQRILFGKGFINDKLCDIEFKISPKSFFQVNSLQTEKLYSLAIEAANITKDDLVLDAYCGIGTIGLIASKKAKQVIGVEIVHDAVIDAINNAKNNNIKNANFYEGDAGDFIFEQYRNNIRFDVVIMDPPRKGSSEQFLSILLKTKPKKIVYVSCDPATLARDLKYLASVYEVKSVTPVDMFPFTNHVETVVLLSRQTPDDYLEVNVELDDDFLTKAESKGTYDQIKQYIYEKYKIKVSNLYIAQVKDSCGIKERANYNYPKKENSKQPQVPEDKRKIILEALKVFKMI